MAIILSIPGIIIPSDIVELRIDPEVISFTE